MDRFEAKMDIPVREHIVYRRQYAHKEFIADYNAFKGNAYGLANTLNQTAFLKPKLKSKLPGTYFAGQLTTPWSRSSAQHHQWTSCRWRNPKVFGNERSI